MVALLVPACLTRAARRRQRALQRFVTELLLDVVVRHTILLVGASCLRTCTCRDRHTHTQTRDDERDAG